MYIQQNKVVMYKKNISIIYNISYQEKELKEKRQNFRKERAVFSTIPMSNLPL